MMLSISASLHGLQTKFSKRLRLPRLSLILMNFTMPLPKILLLMKKLMLFFTLKASSLTVMLATD